jgi:hypothetical protein
MLFITYLMNQVKSMLEQTDITQRRKVRERLDRLLREKARESEWQKFFIEYPLVLLPSVPLRLEPKNIKSIKGETEFEPDFIIYPHQTQVVNPAFGVIELRRVADQVARLTRKNMVLLTANTQSAVNKVKQYGEKAPNLLSMELSGRHFILGNNRNLFVIIGISEEELVSRHGQGLYYNIMQNQLPADMQFLSFEALKNSLADFERDIYFLLPAIKNKDHIPSLRSEPAGLTVDDVEKLLQEKDFYDRMWNWPGTGIDHHYEVIKQDREKIVVDRTTSLIWQQSGSNNYMKREEATAWLNNLNQKGFGGFHTWRLPTLEEAMSLMEAEKNKNGLHLNSIFDDNQKWIWTCDKFTDESLAWVVIFYDGYCYHDRVSSFYYVRAVCSEQLPVEEADHVSETEKIESSLTDSALSPPG